MTQESRDAPVVEQGESDCTGKTGRLEVGHGSVGVDGIEDFGRARGEAKTKTGSEDLGEAFETDDSSGTPSFAVLFFKGPVAAESSSSDSILIEAFEVEVVVRIVFEDEEVVLSASDRIWRLRSSEAVVPAGLAPVGVV